MRSIRDAISIQPTVFPIAPAGTTVITTNGTTVDTIGYNTALIHVACAVLPTGTASIVATLQESSDNSTWANANDNTGTVIGFTLLPTAVGNQQNTARIEGLGLNRKRYLRGVLAVWTSAAGVVATTTATIALGRAYEEPTPITPGASTSPVSNT